MSKFLAMSAPLANGSLNYNTARKIVSYTTTALKRWSCYSPRELPRKPIISRRKDLSDLSKAVSQVKALHVYDFDNTRRCPERFPRLQVAEPNWSS